MDAQKQDLKIAIAVKKDHNGELVEIYSTIQERQRLIRALETCIKILNGGKQIIILN